MKNKHNIDKWPIPAFLLIGIGLGFLLMDEFPMAIPAFGLMGLGIGLLVTFFMLRKKRQK